MREREVIARAQAAFAPMYRFVRSVEGLRTKCHSTTLATEVR
jgi:hypothetical protein